MNRWQFKPYPLTSASNHDKLERSVLRIYFPGKMLLVRIIENDKIDPYFKSG